MGHRCSGCESLWGDAVYVCVLHDASGPGLIRVLITVGPALWGRDTHLSDISLSTRRGAAANCRRGNANGPRQSADSQFMIGWMIDRPDRRSTHRGHRGNNHAAAARARACEPLTNGNISHKCLHPHYTRTHDSSCAPRDRGTGGDPPEPGRLGRWGIRAVQSQARWSAFSLFVPLF